MCMTTKDSGFLQFIQINTDGIRDKDNELRVASREFHGLGNGSDCGVSE